MGPLCGFEPRPGSSRGITLLELLISMGIIGLLATIGAQLYLQALERSRVTRAIADIRVIERMLSARESEGALPEGLADVGWRQRDPWGREYHYMNFAFADPKSLDKDDGKPKKARRDRFLKPLNTTYDLYSAGRDGKSKPTLNHPRSRDDVLRAADGVFVGLGSDF